MSWFKNLNLHPIEVVSRYRDSQLQVGETYLGLNLFNLGPNICKSLEKNIIKNIL